MKKSIPDQIEVWDNKHLNGDHDRLRGVPSPFVEVAEPLLRPKSSILELGCGVGRDAIFFSQKGHEVTATDGSSVVISKNKELLKDSRVKFAVLNMLERMPFKSESIDCVYANFSLHYYDYEATPEIIKEIYRILKTDGILAFACKSKDSHYNNGVQVAKNIFVNANNHAIHFFDTEYTKELLAKDFSIKFLDEIEEDYNGRLSRIVRCVAQKKRMKKNEN